jgi:hypothetical protein
LRCGIALPEIEDLKHGHARVLSHLTDIGRRHRTGRDLS